MITVRKGEERGHTRLDWLDSRHTFSFDRYYDPAQMGFRTLRVINEDRVSPGAGFPTHPHRDMEIVTYVLEGAVAHRDSMGTSSVIRAGDVQRMSAGTGVRHSEFNASANELLHFLQIWIIPAERRLTPSYEQRTPRLSDSPGRLVLLAGPKGGTEAVALHQDVELYGARLGTKDEIIYEFQPGRYGWIQVARGALQLNGIPLQVGDGAAVANEKRLRLTAAANAEVLLFNLA